MQLIANNNPENMILEASSVTNSPKTSFIVANTEKVTLEHLKKECIIPVFSKDNEITISHYEFINETFEKVKQFFPHCQPNTPEIRVSHVIKGRSPDAIGKPAKELLSHEKTIYYERCAFMIELPQIRHRINGNELSLCIGGVRAYNQENLYSRKSLEKFKVFIGFKNNVCTNLCISTDGFSNEIRIASILELENSIDALLSCYDVDRQLGLMQLMGEYELSERQFAHLIGKMRMFNYLDKAEQTNKFSILLNDGQINNVVKNYFSCPNFSRATQGSISLWNLYNLFTESNKSSYIDSHLERNVNTYEFVNHLADSIQNDTFNWYLH